MRTDCTCAPSREFSGGGPCAMALLSYDQLVCVVAGGVCGAVLLRLYERYAKAPVKFVPKPSTIRLMTRLAVKHGATNLSQGFPNEPPPREMLLAAAGALLNGANTDVATKQAAKLEALLPIAPYDGTEKDMLSQYSYPFGTPFLREAIGKYYNMLYPGLPADPEDNITVVLGATEGFAVCLRALCEPGAAVVFFQPFHELYTGQSILWGMRPRAITLYEKVDDSSADGVSWVYDSADLEKQLKGATLLLFNSPHNPTGACNERTKGDGTRANNLYVVRYLACAFRQGLLGGGAR